MSSEHRKKLKQAKLLGKALQSNNSSDDDHKPGENKFVTGNIEVSGAIYTFRTQDAIAEHNAERNEDNTHKNDTRTHEGRTRIMAFWTLIVSALYFITTVCILIQTIRSTNIAANALSDSRNNVRLDMRAWVTITCEKWTLSNDGKGPLVAYLTVENTGKTHAKNFEFKYSAQIFERTRQPNFTFPKRLYRTQVPTPFIVPHQKIPNMEVAVLDQDTAQPETISKQDSPYCFLP